MSANCWTSLLSILLLLWTVDLASTQGAPSQVTGVSLYKEVRQGRPSLRVTWTAPQSDVDISEYLMQYKRNETTLWGYQITISAPTTSAYLSRLYTGTEYDVRVRAVSAAGEGEWSEELTERTFAVPSRVSHVILTWTITTGVQSLWVTWTTPQSDMAISQYQVQYRKHGTTSWNNSIDISGSPPANSTTLTSLDAGMQYQAKVRALSQLGVGKWSVEQTSRAFQMPSRVSGVSLTKIMASGTPALIVAWTTPQSDMAISQYQVEYRRNGTTSWRSAVSVSVLPQTTHSILSKLNAGTEYMVRVRALSEVGAGEWSVVQTGRTVRSEFNIHSCASGTDNSFLQSSIVAAVCTCQVEVVLVAIVTFLVVYFVTKRAVQQHPKSRQDRSGSTAEPIGLAMKDATYESASDGDATGREIVKMQLSPAYRSIPK